MKTRAAHSVHDLKGVVQGVGFRPAVYRFAVERGLGGSVQNRAGVVRLILEGDAKDLESFLRDLPSHLPPQARVESCVLVEWTPRDASECARDFHILPSGEGENMEILIPPDLAVCPECMADVIDPKNRRHGYAFTTCTDCGPRYTVLTAMPYDRERTTMSAFPMCPDCRREYTRPADRRIHA
jgi:hydrogenase maturation protein HypF